MKTFAENLSALPTLDHLSALQLHDAYGVSHATIENKPGAQGSFRVYHFVANKWDGLGPEAAREALENSPTRPHLIAVTLLTSMQDADLAELGIAGTAQQNVMRLAQLTQDCGLDGVVCSAREVNALRQALGQEFLLVTPGIRPAQAERGDQARVATPQEAIRNGSSYLVIGRPITQAADPLAALAAVRREIGEI